MGSALSLTNLTNPTVIIVLAHNQGIVKEITIRCPVTLIIICYAFPKPFDSGVTRYIVTPSNL